MTRVYLQFDAKAWKEVEHSDFWFDNPLYQRLKNLKKIQKKGWDGVFIVDGPERSGKSILAMTCGWYLSDTKLTKNNFATGLEDCAKKIAELPDGSVIILDEGSILFSSKDSTTKEQRQLIKILDVVGQKNLIFIICLPCFFDLNKTIAVRRSKYLLHVYPDEDYNRGQYVCWGEKSKAKLYRIGKKDYDSYSYPPYDDEPGMFLNFHPPFYEEYIEEIKKKSLQEVLNSAQNNMGESKKMHALRVKFAGRIKEKTGFTDEKIADLLDTTQQYVSELIQEYKQKQEEEAVKGENK